MYLFFILAYFLPFYPLNSSKNQNFKKLKNSPGDVIILHKCIKNHNHRLYCSCNMVRDGCNCYFSFWAIFCLKNENFKKMKKHLGISFYRSVSKIMIICCSVPKIWHMTDVHFGHFCPFTPPPLS